MREGTDAKAGVTGLGMVDTGVVRRPGDCGSSSHRMLSVT